MGRGAKDERLSRLRDVTMPIVTVYVFSRVRFAIGMANDREWISLSLFGNFSPAWNLEFVRYRD